MFLLWATIILFLCYAGLICLYRWGWMGLPAFSLTARPASTYSTKVTVLIPARNETVNIANCIRSVLAQSYPAALIEVIVIDDNSTDDTADIAAALALAYPNVRLIELKATLANMAYKKKAIEEGVKAATGTLIITTDADCTHDRFWIETLVQFRESRDASFIAAPVGYHTQANVLNVFQSLDFMTMQGITGGSVHKHLHTMCNGANLCYTKAAFEQVNGFAGIDDLPTGDDMLLMQKISDLDRSKVFYLKSDTAIVSTHPAYSWTEFLHQRIRWASKSTHYADKRITAALFIVYLLNAWSLVLLLATLFWWKAWLILFGMIVCKTLLELWFIQPVAAFFKMSRWLRWFPFLQPLHIGYVIISGFLGKFGSYRWKGRTIGQQH